MAGIWGVNMQKSEWFLNVKFQCKFASTSQLYKILKVPRTVCTFIEVSVYVYAFIYTTSEHQWATTIKNHIYTCTSYMWRDGHCCKLQIYIVVPCCTNCTTLECILCFCAVHKVYLCSAQCVFVSHLHSYAHHPCITNHFEESFPIVRKQSVFKEHLFSIFDPTYEIYLTNKFVLGVFEV